MKYIFNVEYDKVNIADYLLISDKKFKQVHILYDLEMHILDYLLEFDSEIVNDLLKKEFGDGYDEIEYRYFLNELILKEILIESNA